MKKTKSIIPCSKCAKYTASLITLLTRVTTPEVSLRYAINTLLDDLFNLHKANYSDEHNAYRDSLRCEIGELLREMTREEESQD